MREMQAAAIQAQNGIYKQAGAANSVERQISGLRNAYSDLANATGEMQVRQIKAASAVDVYSRRLQEQKIHFAEAIKQRKMFNEVVKQQIALQQAETISWKKLPDGRTSADLVISNDFADKTMQRRMQLSMFNEVLKSGSDNMVKWGKNTQWAGRQLMVGFSVPMGIAAAATGKLAYDMDQSLTQITKVYGDANSEFQDTAESIRATALNTAKDMATIYGQSAKDTLEIQAQFAAAGKTGAELQEATAAATKARMLNEMDLQTAIEASITMQTVYGYSAEELGQKWDYINAVANQTVLGAEDFAVAIPKVAGVLNELGAGLEDTGVLMTAFKAAGIDAAEGANALKTISFRSVAAYGKGLETFKNQTGQDLKQIVNETNGETIPTLMRMYGAMENLSNPQKIAVVKDVFGIYQGNKALMLLEQMATQSDQVAQAMAVGENSVAENAKIAQQELERMNNQPFKKIQKAVEEIKIQMAEAGKAVLPLAATFLNAVQGVAEFFNSLGEGKKIGLLAGAALIALAGPVTMLLGLFANLIGNVVKMGASLGGLVTRFKVTNATERAQILLNKQATASWDQQTGAVARLTQELQKLNAIQAASNAALSGKSEAIPQQRLASIGAGDGGTISQKDKTGRWQHFLVDAEGKKKRISEERLRVLERERVTLGKIQEQERVRLDSMHEQALVMNQQYDKARSRAAGVGAGLAGAGLVGSMFGSGKIADVSMVAAGVGTLLNLFPNVGVSIAKNLVSPFRLLGPVAVNSLKNAGSAALTFAKSAAVPMGLALAGVLLYWQKVNQSAEEGRKKAEAYANSARSLAELHGQSWNDPTKAPTESQTGRQTTTQFAAKFREESRAEYDALRVAGREAGDVWGVALAKGAQVKLHGGTTEAAKQAARTALDIMGKNFDDEQFEVEINTRINFDNIDNLLRRTVDAAINDQKKAVNDLGTGWEGWNRKNGLIAGLFNSGNDDLTEGARVTATKAGEEFYNALEKVEDPQRAKKAFESYIEGSTGSLNKMYQRLVKDQNNLLFKHDKDGRRVVKSFNEWLQEINQGHTGSLQHGLGLSDQETEEVGRKVEAIKYGIEGIAKAGTDLSDSEISKMYDPKMLEGYLKGIFEVGKAQDKLEPGIDILNENKQMHEEYGEMMDRAAQSGRSLSAAERLKMLNIVRANHGLAAATSLTQGFNIAQVKAAEATMTLADAIEKMGLKTTEEQMTSTYRDAMQATQGDLIQAATESLDREAELASDRLDKQMDAAMDSFDRRSDALDSKYDKRSDALEKKFDNREKTQEARQDRETKRLDSKWETRIKKETNYYDNRVKNVETLIEREEKAEETRQKIFEAEKTRIQRLSEMYNRSVDLNVALKTGKIDEAAKISNDALAQTQQWSLDDSAAMAGDASKTRIESLNKQKEKVESEKSIRLDALKKIEEAEKASLVAKHKVENEKLKAARDAATKELAARRDAANKALQAERSAAQKTFESRKQTTQRIWEDRKRKLELELSTLRAFIPRNNAELNKQANDIKVAYNKYGKDLRGQGESWSKYIGSSLNRNVKASGNSLANEVNWTKIGSQITNGLLKGGLGMTASQFGKWLNGGEAPVGSPMSPKYKMSQKQRMAYDLRHQGRHKGGVISRGGGGDRTGHSGSTQSQSETWINALYGESVLNRKATDMIGEDNINYLNKGKLPPNTGPWVGGFPAAMAAIAAASVKNLQDSLFMGLAQRRMQMDAGQIMGVAGKAGKYGGTNLSEEQLKNAATIMGVGKSMGASQRDLIIALMTAAQESMLRNIRYGDRDSIGLFQQRPSQGWGTIDQIMDPKYSSRKFFETLFKVKDRNKLPLTVAAQKVQRSAYPNAYAKWESMARAIAGATSFVSGQSGSLNDAAMALAAGVNLGGGSQFAPDLSGSWIRPSSGRVSSEFGMRWGRLHNGIDLAAATGTNIYASRGGRVTQVRYGSGVGNYTMVDHGNGLTTGYAHQSRQLVSLGQSVSKGQLIGKVGNTGNSTGPHLHFSVFSGGKAINPRMVIPKFSEGGYTLSNGLAELHPQETVLSKPLSKDLHTGLDRFANGDTSEYNIALDLRGANISSDVNLERVVEKAVKKALNEKESRLGRTRKIGGSSK